MLSYPIVAFHVNDQRRPLSKCLWTEAALELLDVEVDLPMVLQSLRVEETFAATLKLALVRPLSGVFHQVTLQVVFVVALCSTDRADDFLCSAF